MSQAQICAPELVMYLPQSIIYKDHRRVVHLSSTTLLVLTLCTMLCPISHHATFAFTLNSRAQTSPLETKVQDPAAAVNVYTSTPYP